MSNSYSYHVFIGTTHLYIRINLRDLESLQVVYNGIKVGFNAILSYCCTGRLCVHHSTCWWFWTNRKYPRHGWICVLRRLQWFYFFWFRFRKWKPCWKLTTIWIYLLRRQMPRVISKSSKYKFSDKEKAICSGVVKRFD